MSGPHTRAVGGVRVQRPGERRAEWGAWLARLKTGDEVLVCHCETGQSIFIDRVRVTPTGRIHIGRDRINWRAEGVHVPGGGDRFIAPIPPSLAPPGSPA
jgi:hypothetical protein